MYAMTHKLYGGKYSLKLMPHGHKYLIGGQERPGVTSVLAILNKPGIPQWAANQVVEFIKNDSKPFPEHEGQKAWIVTEFDLKRSRTAFLRRRDGSADIGKQVHKWIEGHIDRKLKGQKSEPKLSELPEELRPSIESFLKWEKKYQPKYIFSERIVYSEKHGYCGTCDVGIIIKEKNKETRIILDFKTGKPERQYDVKTKRYTGRKRAYTTVFMQDAMYDMAIEEEDGIRADKYGALYLSTNGELLFALTAQTEVFREAATDILHLYKSLNKANYLNKWN